MDAALEHKRPDRMYARVLAGAAEAIWSPAPAPIRRLSGRNQPQVLANTRDLLPLTPGGPVRHNPEYQRKRVVTCFLVSEPLRGWRQVWLSARRTRIDWAHCIQKLNDVHSPQAGSIVLVMDQRNTHSPADLDEAFPPAETKRLADRSEIHHSPKHGSWLNMAEIELSILARQGLHRRLDVRAMMEQDVAAGPR